MANTTKGRVFIPRQPKEGFDLAKKVFAKHVSDGTNSELYNLDGYDWDKFGPGIAQGQAYHEAAEKLKGQMEEQYRLRDAAFAPIDELNRASAAYLKGKYVKNPKKLAEWGYEVDDTPKVKKPKAGGQVG